MSSNPALGEHSPSCLVTIGIATFRRPAPLSRLLDAIVDVVTATSERSDGRWRVAEVVIVDDDPAGTAQEAVIARASAYPVPLLYVHVGAMNVATARNSIIEASALASDWVAVVDDDCVPAPDWVWQLVNAAHHFQTGFITSGVRYELEDPQTGWMVREPFMEDTGVLPDGAVTAIGSTASALWNLDVLRTQGIRFRSEFGLTGGEDMVFYSDLRSEGHQIVHSEFARVTEFVPEERSHVRFQVSQRMWFGNNKVWVSRGRGDYSALRMVKHAVGLVLSALVFFVRNLGGRYVAWRWVVAELAQAVGIVLGVCGKRLSHDGKRKK